MTITKSHFIAAVTASALVLTGGAVLAQGDGKRTPVKFETLDADGDGQISKEEIKARGAARLAEVDTDGDGLLSVEELTAKAMADAERRTMRMIERLDKDADGKLSAAELERSGRGNRIFRRMDGDSDGSISRAEYDHAMMHRKDRRQRRGHGN